MAQINLAGFKKMKEDKKTVTMAHPTGHSITILKSKLPALQREQLKRLPIHASSGNAGVGGFKSPDEEAKEDIKKMHEESARRTEEEAKKKKPKRFADGGDSSDGDSDSTPIDTGTDIINSGPVSDDRFTQDQQTPTDQVSSDTVPSYTFDPVTDSARNQAAPVGAYEPNTAPSAPGQTPTPITSQPTGQMGAADNINLNDIYSKENAAIDQKATAEAAMHSNQAKIEHQNQLDLQSAQDNWNKSSQSMLGDISSALDDVKNGHIDPTHYQENMSSGQKVSTAIGLLIGGFTGGFNKTGVNPAADWLNGQINRDIESQKANQTNKLNVYNAYLDKYKNAAVADQMARATQLGIYKSKIEEAAAKAGTPLALYNGQIESAKLARDMLPLFQNAHLLQQADQFTGNSGGAQAGSEAQFNTLLNNSQRINPEFAKDLQSKYVPSVGIATHPVADVDRERLTSINSLIPLIDQAQQDAKRFGRLGAWTPQNQADAISDKEALTAGLGQLTKNNRLNDNVYNNYGAQVGGIGGHDIFGGETETLSRLRQQAEMDRNSAITSAGIKPFSNSLSPTALAPSQDAKLKIFLQNNPGVPQDKALDILKQRGIIKGG